MPFGGSPLWDLLVYHVTIAAPYPGGIDPRLAVYARSWDGHYTTTRRDRLTTIASAAPFALWSPVGSRFSMGCNPQRCTCFSNCFKQRKRWWFWITAQTNFSVTTMDNEAAHLGSKRLNTGCKWIALKVFGSGAVEVGLKQSSSEIIRMEPFTQSELRLKLMLTNLPFFTRKTPSLKCWISQPARTMWPSASKGQLMFAIMKRSRKITPLKVNSCKSCVTHVKFSTLCINEVLSNCLMLTWLTNISVSQRQCAGICTWVQNDLGRRNTGWLLRCSNTAWTWCCMLRWSISFNLSNHNIGFVSLKFAAISFPVSHGTTVVASANISGLWLCLPTFFGGRSTTFATLLRVSLPFTTIFRFAFVLFGNRNSLCFSNDLWLRRVEK